MKKSISNTRPLPQRTCAACRQIKSKREMIRLVLTPAGNVEIDISGRKEGRGTYLCKDSICWEKALKGNQLAHALKGKVASNSLERLYQEGKDLLKELTSG